METLLEKHLIQTQDGAADAIYVHPTVDGPWPGVVLYMDAFGLRPRLEEMAARLAAEGYAVLVPNVFYRAGPAPVVELGDISTQEGQSATFGKLMPLIQQLTPELAERDAAAYLDFLANRPEVEQPYGVVGYCMGGRLALGAAAVAGERAAAVASFHASRMVTDDDTSPHRLLPRIRGEVYVAHADHDAGMPPEQQEQFAAAMREAGLTYAAEQYDEARHGFTMSDTPVFDAAATERHWQALLGLFDRQLH
ncbi:MAG TPA: dienelactone hydrolase family protein [Nocardioidaceae bacterium]|nr:dienelactone hydrolase family protein [Nocardioidaceae bacterium]